MPSAIVVIDDDASVRAATNNLLESHGYRVRSFESAEEFLESGDLEDNSCVIADVQMAGMSGLDLLRHMRDRGYRVPFVVVTAFPDDAMRARALDSGVICFLAKPFASSALVKCIEVALSHQLPSTPNKSASVSAKALEMLKCRR
jgi:FixJ family two-component response regulator